MSMREQYLADNRAVENIRNDRSSLRLDIAQRNWTVVENIAYGIGRLSNEINFAMSMEWMALSGSNRSVRELFLQLRSLIRYLVSASEIEFDEEVVDLQQQAWEESLDSVWRGETVFDFYDRFDAEGELTLTAAVIQELYAIGEMLKRNSTMFSAVLNGEVLACFHLGRLVDQLIHPELNALKVSFLKSRAPTSLPDPDSNVWASDQGIPSNRLMDDVRSGNVEAIPNSSWLRNELRERLNHLMQDLNLEIVSESAWRSTEPEPWSASEVIDSVEGGLFASNGNYAELLGITINDDGSVSRSGYACDSTLTNQQLKLLRHFLNRHDNPTDLSCLMNNWRELGGRSTPNNRGAVDTAISGLNRNLEQLCLEVRNDNGQWCLRDNHTDRVANSS